jgi:exosome complex exonuclease DIS3/RRP44
LSKKEIESGLREGRLFQGPLRMNRDNYLEGNVPVSDEKLKELSGEEEILISGLENLNRAINGDIVAVELLPKDQVCIG